MTTTCNAPGAEVAARDRAPLRPNAALALLASIIVSFLAASSAPTPLYAVYQAEWGFTPITTTIVFGVYALAVLAALLVFGRVSDHLGRRPVLLAALAVQAAAMLMFAAAGSVTTLLAARVVQGLSTGAAMGAVGAGMLDIDRPRGTVANSVAPGTGTATGALASALIVQYLPAPTRLVYYLLLAGVGFGSGFQGGIRLVVPLAQAHERAGVLSLLYVVSYLGMAVPAVLAGVLVVHFGGLLTTAREYGIAVIVLAGAALIGLLTSRPASGPGAATARL